MTKYIFRERPKHPFHEITLVPGASYTLCDPSRANRRGGCYGVGKLVYQQGRRRWVVLCYDRVCDNYFRSIAR